MARKPTTSRSEIEELLAKGFTRTEIAEIKGITTAGVSWHLRNSGGKPLVTDSERRRMSLPWALTGKPLETSPYRELMYHLEYQETGGTSMSPTKLDRLRKFYKRLTDFSAVLRHDPEIPPLPGRKYGGFEYVPREAADGNMILRIDDHTQISEEDRAKWQLPAGEDWPE